MMTRNVAPLQLPCSQRLMMALRSRHIRTGLLCNNFWSRSSTIPMVHQRDTHSAEAVVTRRETRCSARRRWATQTHTHTQTACPTHTELVLHDPRSAAHAHLNGRHGWADGALGECGRARGDRFLWGTVNFDTRNALTLVRLWIAISSKSL